MMTADTFTGALNYRTDRRFSTINWFSNDLTIGSVGNDADESTSGTLTLFNPSSTTYVKHFISTSESYNTEDDYY
jgi:hypothetical protein